ncbi:unnamed protein product, partial [Effrenium voratum]
AIEIMRDFDEYDPDIKLTVIRDFSGDIMRQRRKKGLGDTSSTSDTESPGTDSLTSSEFKSYEPEDAITNWGVLVGKAIWCRMKGPGQNGNRRKLGLVSAAFAGTYGHCLNFTATPSEKERERSKPRQARGAQRRAATVVSQLQELVKRVSKETEDKLDGRWKEDALSFLFSADYVDTLIMLASGARRCFEQEQTVVQARQPCRVFGDIHGQLRDLLLFFHAFGLPGQGRSVVFNGDFVDRGAHQLEVIGVLFALKITYPSHVWLVRGNHEDSCMNRKYGFEEQCNERLGSLGRKTFDLYQKTFEWLPLACLIEDQILTVHGGIGDGKWTIAELSCVKRPLQSEDFQAPGRRWLYNILWSDPIPEDSSTDAGLFGVHSSPRTDLALQFGW